MNLPRLVGLKTYVSDLSVARHFWRKHFRLTPSSSGDEMQYELGDIIWQILPGGRFCGTRGPHGALPVFGIDDFSHARGYLLAHDIPIVFEEMLPGLNLLIFLDLDSNPFELAQKTAPSEWDITQRKALRTKRRIDAPQAEPISLLGIHELTIYTHNITASVSFWRDVVGLPVGLSFFAHVHLAAENVTVVLRTTRWQCKAPELLHGTAPVFAVSNIIALETRLRNAHFHPMRDGVTLSVRDPIGMRVHFIEQSIAL